jgi:hypothetical protein
MGTMHQPEYLPATRDIYETFADEVMSLGGSVPDVYDDGHRLFARAVLPAHTEVHPGDAIRAGVAVRATGADILVHPYTFRQICSNGAIAAHALETRRLERMLSTEVFVAAYDVEVGLTDLRLAVRACAAREAFDASAQAMRSASEVQADIALHLLPLLARMPERMSARVLPAIFQRFAGGGDRSAFGLMNAVTSVARDTRDPETRWQLEELGGTMPARLGPAPRIMPPVRELVVA